MLLSFLNVAWMIAKWFIIPIGVFFALIGVLLSLYLGAAFAKGRRRPAGEHRLSRRPDLFKNLF